VIAALTLAVFAQYLNKFDPSELVNIEAYLFGHQGRG
jgi:hypothetical protein